uniref:Uncharacterized protein ycf35 n=1 Tax=Chondria tumulosa TaxID=2740715 RepID=A0A896SV18_9FLOR|nr:hypothetical protein K8K75_pgp172 [Chondria tumulosa]QSD57035.1 hypothetical protein [Chondria tumulosa]
MSHFSKIRTNISNSDVLLKTLDQMGFDCEYFDSKNVSVPCNLSIHNVAVYDFSKNKKQLFGFIWNESQYNLVADLDLWSLDMDFNYFVDLLSQRYAYNMILNQSSVGGFCKVDENILSDGSIKVVLRKWSNDNFS